MLHPYLLFALILLASPSHAFVTSTKSILQNPQFQVSPVLLQNRNAQQRQTALLRMKQDPSVVPAFVYKLNSSTKWLVTLGSLIGIWSRPKHFLGPFIVVGSIVAVYFTVFLKQIINQGRPDGAPFADPGMPSSHSLVSFFLAMAWTRAVGGQVALLAAATTVAILRVVCGYHTIAQVVVGACIGSILGHNWVSLGHWWYGMNPKLAFVVAWAAYLGGSVFYIHKDIRKWLTDDKHL